MCACIYVCMHKCVVRICIDKIIIAPEEYSRRKVIPKFIVPERNDVWKRTVSDN